MYKICQAVQMEKLMYRKQVHMMHNKIITQKENNKEIKVEERKWKKGKQKDRYTVESWIPGYLIAKLKQMYF